MPGRGWIPSPAPPMRRARWCLRLAVYYLRGMPASWVRPPPSPPNDPSTPATNPLPAIFTEQASGSRMQSAQDVGLH